MAQAADHWRATAARPRATSSESAKDARRYCADSLRALGFAVTEHRFRYSALPGKWGTPLFGIIGGVLLVLDAFIAAHETRALAGMILAAGSLAVIALWVARHGVMQLGAMRATGVNLEATRDAQPRVWLVAHVDSKSQTVPMFARIAGIVVLALAWIVSLGMAVAGAVRGAPLAAAWWWAVAIVGGIAAVPVAITFVGNSSDGALDNASGVAAVLRAAELLDSDSRVGVLITDAEELGLGGAHAWMAARTKAKRTSRPFMLNCDGVDDAGAFRAVYSGRAPERLVAAMEQGAGDAGERVTIARLAPGILVDAVAFAQGGLDALTLMKGNAATLLRVHTGSDSMARMTGGALESAARILARAALHAAALPND